MMVSHRGMCSIFIALATLVGVCTACHPNQATGCPNYDLLSTVSVIPLLNPTQLDENCRHMKEGLNCLTGPGVFGNCDKTNPMKQIYLAMLKVIDIPCRTAREEYKSGSACLRSGPGTPLSEDMSRCFLLNQRVINVNYCDGMEKFLACIVTKIMEIPSCNNTQRDIIHAMVATYMNELTDLNSCEKVDIPSLTTTTTTTTSTTTTTQPKIASTPQIPVVVSLSTRKTASKVTSATVASSEDSNTMTNPSYRVAQSKPTNDGNQNAAFLVLHTVIAFVTFFVCEW